MQRSTSSTGASAIRAAGGRAAWKTFCSPSSTTRRQIPRSRSGPDCDRGRLAGGHLALLAGAERSIPVIAMAAGSDLEAWQSEASGVSFIGDGSRQEANPRRRVPIGVRQVFVHGTDDDQVPYWLSPAFVEASLASPPATRRNW